MKHMMILCAGLFAGSLMAADDLPTVSELAHAELAAVPAEAAFGISVNGERFLKVGNAKVLFSGEQLLDETGFKSFQASGELVVRLAGASAEGLAANFGVSVLNTYGKFAVVKAPASAELLALAAAIDADAGVASVSVHLVDLTTKGQ